MGSVSVIGMGPAGGEFVLPAGTARIRQADILIGGERHVRPYKNSGKEIIQLKGNWKTAADRIASAGSDKNIAVLVSGDPALYSYTAVLQRQLAGTDIDIVPGISSFQYLSAVLGINWNGGAVLSFHGGPPLSKAPPHSDSGEQDGGRGGQLLTLCRTVKTVIIFTDKQNNPGVVCRFLVDNLPRTNDNTAWRAHIGCNLGETDEQIVTLPLAECAETWKDTEQLCVMILKKM